MINYKFRIKLQVKIIYGLRWIFHSLSVVLVLLHYSLFCCFLLTQCWSMWVNSFHTSISKWCTLAAVLLKDITPTALLCIFPFLLHIPGVFPHDQEWVLSQHDQLSIRTDSPKRQSYVLISSVQLSTSYLKTLTVCRSVLLLI